MEAHLGAIGTYPGAMDHPAAMEAYPGLCKAPPGAMETRPGVVRAHNGA